MSLKAGFLTSSGENINVYTSRDLIKPFEFLFYEDKNTPPYGIIPGMLGAMSCYLYKSGNNLQIYTRSGGTIIRNPLDQSNKKISQITDLYSLEHNVIYDSVNHARNLNGSSGTFTSTTNRTFPSYNGSDETTQITYTSKTFFDIFREHRYTKSGYSYGDLLILEVYLSTYRSTSSSIETVYTELKKKPSDWDSNYSEYFYLNNDQYVANSSSVWDNNKTYFSCKTNVLRNVFGMNWNYKNISVVNCYSSPEEWFYNCNNGKTIDDFRDKDLLGFIVGNLSYNPNANNSDPTDLQIFQNAMYFYDCRKFSKNIIVDSEEFLDFMKIKKTLVFLYTVIFGFTTNSDFIGNLSRGEIIARNFGIHSTLGIDYLINIFVDAGCDREDASNFINNYIYGDGHNTFNSLDEVKTFINNYDTSLIDIDDLSFIINTPMQKYTSSNFTYHTNFEQYSLENKNLVYVSGNIVKIYGSIRYTGSTTTDVVGYRTFLMCTLPADVPKPKHPIYLRSQCSNGGEYVLTIEPETGNIYASRIVRNAKWDKMLKNEWLHIEAFYIV